MTQCEHIFLPLTDYQICHLPEDRRLLYLEQEREWRIARRMPPRTNPIDPMVGWLRHVATLPLDDIARLANKFMLHYQPYYDHQIKSGYAHKEELDALLNDEILA